MVSGARRRRVGVGDRILAGGTPNVVVSVSGTRVRLADDEGRVVTVAAAELADGTRFEIPAAASPRGPRPETGLEGLPAAVVGEASWWEAHIAEVVYGLRPDAPAGDAAEAAVRPGAHEPDRTGEGEGRRAVGARACRSRPARSSTAASGGRLTACPAWLTGGWPGGSGPPGGLTRRSWPRCGRRSARRPGRRPGQRVS